jgi:uncharacterized membrane protein
MKPRLYLRAHFVYAALLAGVVAWLSLIYAAPLLMAEHRYRPAFYLYAGFSTVCHQMPERSFHALGYPLAVCARCAGVYAGFLLGLIAYPLVRRLDEETMPARRWLMLAAAPALVDLAGDAAGLFANTCFSRAATGLVAGAGAAFYILPGLVAIKFAIQSRRR